MSFGFDVVAMMDYLLRLTTDPLFLFYFLKLWGWLIFIWPIMWMTHLTYVSLQINKDRAKWEHILLAIDVPKDNETGPKAVENIFAHLAGAHASADVQEIHLQGITQKWFSFEIISIEGYVQFIIWTEKSFRNLIEAAIYAQYPDAEINEVEDYTKDVPSQFPSEDWDVWGADFKLTMPYHYPIRSYEEYEDGLAGVFYDPMTALVETMSRMGPGEQLWMQILIKPIGVGWKAKGYDLVNELAGKQKTKKKGGIVSDIGSIPAKVWDDIVTYGFGGAPIVGTKKEENKMPSMLLHLTDGEKETIKAIEHKLGKIGFGVKVRVLYIGKKGYFKKSNAVQGIVGSIKQFNSEDLNALIPDMKWTAVTAHYFFTEERKNWRKTKLVSRYKARSIWAGTPEYVMNTEELATLWHFPVTVNRQPMLSQTMAKKGGAPSSLPSGRVSQFAKKPPASSIPPVEPPTNLPT